MSVTFKFGGISDIGTSDDRVRLVYTDDVNATAVTTNTIDELTADTGVTVDSLRIREDTLTTPAMTLQSMVATGAATAISVAILPKGNGALIAAIPDNAATGGNIRGTYAVDLQLDRVANTNVASGLYSTLGGGRGNTASGSYACVPGGRSNIASGIYGFAVGFSNTASGASSIAIGNSATASHDNSVVIATSSASSTAASQMVCNFTNGYSFLGGTATFAGVINTDAHPRVEARISSAQSIPNITVTTVVYNTEIFDTASIYNTATGVSTVTIKGVYAVTSHVTFAASATANVRILSIYRAGVVVQTDYKTPSATLNRMCISGTFQCDVGDTLYIGFYQDSGGALQVNSNASSGLHIQLLYAVA